MFKHTVNIGGRSSCAYRGGVLLMGGAEGILRRVENPDDFLEDETRLSLRDFFEVDNSGVKQIVGLSCVGGDILVGIEEEQFSYQVSLLDGDSGTLKMMLAKGQLGLRDVALSVADGGKWAAIATDADGLRLVPIDDMTNVKELNDHEGAVKAVSWDPLGEYLASVGADGSLRIWSVRGGEFSLLKHAKNAVVRDDSGITSTNCCAAIRPCWSSDGALFALPCGNSVIHVIPRAVFSTPGESLSLLAGEGDSVGGGGIVTLKNFDQPDWCWTNVAFLGDNKTLAASCVSSTDRELNGSTLTNPGDLIVFDVPSRKILNEFPLDLPLYCLLAHPNPSLRSWTGMNSDGELVIFKASSSSAPSSSASSSSDVASSSTETEANDPTTVPEHPSTKRDSDEKEKHDNNNNNNNNNRDDDQVGESLLQIKAELGIGPEGERLFPEGDASHGNKRNDGKDDDEGNDYDAGLGYGDVPTLASEKALNAIQREQEELAERLRALEKRFTRRVVPFQPASTYNPEDTRCYLAWNAVGAVAARREDDDMRQTIEIDFWDGRRPVRISGESFRMAALASNGVFFARPGKEGETEEDDNTKAFEEDDERIPEVCYRAFSPLTSSEIEWRLQFSPKETVLAIACSESFCAAATSRGFVRVFRPSGLQELPFSVPGSVISLTAAHSLLFILHAAPLFPSVSPAGAAQALSYTLLNVGREWESGVCARVISTGFLPGGGEVTWIGFTDAELGRVPCAMRSDGTLFALSPASHAWSVIFDQRVSTSVAPALSPRERVWPVAVSRAGGVLGFRVRAAANLHEGPAVTVPRPVPESFPLRAPLVGLSSKPASRKFEQEDDALRSSFAIEQRQWMRVEARNERGVENDDETEAEFEASLASAEALADLAVIKHLVFCLKSGKFARAVGLALRLRLQKSLEVVLQKASEANTPREVIEKLVEIADVRAAERALQAEQLQQRPTEIRDDEDDDYRHTSGGGGAATESPSQRARNLSGQFDEEYRASSRYASPQRPTHHERQGETERENDVNETSPPSSKRAKVMSTNVGAVSEGRKAIRNPFLKTASPGGRDNAKAAAAYLSRSPAKIPELSRESSFAVQSRENAHRSHFKRNLMGTGA